MHPAGPSRAAAPRCRGRCCDVVVHVVEVRPRPAFAARCTTACAWRSARSSLRGHARAGRRRRALRRRPPPGARGPPAPPAVGVRRRARPRRSARAATWWPSAPTAVRPPQRRRTRLRALRPPCPPTLARPAPAAAGVGTLVPRTAAPPPARASGQTPRGGLVSDGSGPGGRAAFASLHGPRDDRRPRDRPHRDVRRRPGLVRRLAERVVCAARRATLLTPHPHDRGAAGVAAAVHPRRRPGRLRRRPCRTTVLGRLPVEHRERIVLRFHDLVLQRAGRAARPDPARGRQGPARTRSRRSPTRRWCAGTTAAAPPATCGRAGGRALPLLTRTVELRHPEGRRRRRSRRGTTRFTWRSPTRSPRCWPATPWSCSPTAQSALTALQAVAARGGRAAERRAAGRRRAVPSVGPAVLDAADYVCFTGSTAHRTPRRAAGRGAGWSAPRSSSAARTRCTSLPTPT